jgi:phage-related protein
MTYSVEYFNERVLAEIEGWPDGLLADYARLVELLMEFGPDLRMPRSRALGNGLFELRPRGREGIGRVMYGYIDGERVVVLHAFIKKTRATPGSGSPASTPTCTGCSLQTSFERVSASFASSVHLASASSLWFRRHAPPRLTT